MKWKETALFKILAVAYRKLGYVAVWWFKTILKKMKELFTPYRNSHILRKTLVTPSHPIINYISNKIPSSQKRREWTEFEKCGAWIINRMKILLRLAGKEKFVNKKIIVSFSNLEDKMDTNESNTFTKLIGLPRRLSNDIISDQVNFKKNSSRLGLYLVIIALAVLIGSIVYLFFSGKMEIYGLGPRLTIESLIIGIGILLVSFILMTLPTWMVVSYHSVQHEILVNKIRGDLWLCGLDDKELNSKMTDFENTNSFRAFALPMAINLALVFVMWGVVIMPGGFTKVASSLMTGEYLGVGFYGPNIRSFFETMASSASLVTWSFLGAYFYILIVLVRRWLQSDLTTGILWKLNVRVVVSLIVGLLLMGTGITVPVFIAFTVGIVPDTVLRWLNQLSKKIVNLEGEGIDKVFKPSELQVKIDGLNFWQIDRLSEEGIESIQDLAMKEIPDLLISTRFDTPHFLYWVDQALLCNQVGDQVDMFKNAFIRTASDLLEIHKKKGVEGVWQSIQDAQSKVKPSASAGNVAEQSNTINTSSMINNVIIAIKSGPNIAYIQDYWKNTYTTKMRRQRLDITYTKLDEEK